MITEKLASVLTGASESQLRYWRKQNLLVPELRSSNPPLYSFQDLVALRTIVFLRAHTSLQTVRKAFRNLSLYDLCEHPSRYRLLPTDDGSVGVRLPDGGMVDLVKHAGLEMDTSFVDVFKPFPNMQDVEVVDFRHPRPRLEVSGDRLGGYPVVEGTRVPFDEVARAIDGRHITVENVARFYPGVTAEAAHDAISLDHQVSAVGA